MDQSIETPIRVGEWCVNPAAGQISNGERVVRVDARAMRLLVYLAERPGQTVSIEELLDRVWSGVVVTQDSVYQAVASLRRQLGDEPKNPAYIVTVPRLGYRMVAAVGPWTDSPVSPPPVERRRWPAAAAVSVAAVLALGIYLGFERNAAGPAANAAATNKSIEYSVAVLPFLDLTTQAMNEEFFADGLTEELIGDLSKVPGFRVPAPTSSFSLKGKQQSVPEIARQFGVAYILDGSVRKSGSVYRVAARLVRADTGFVTWTESYDRPLGDLVLVQKDVAAQVTKAVRALLDGSG